MSDSETLLFSFYS